LLLQPLLATQHAVPVSVSAVVVVKYRQYIILLFIIIIIFISNGWSALERGVLMTRLINTPGTVRIGHVYINMSCWQPKPGLPDADCSERLLSRAWL